jgi:hypothetical protein
MKILGKAVQKLYRFNCPSLVGGIAKGGVLNKSSFFYIFPVRR